MGFAHEIEICVRLEVGSEKRRERKGERKERLAEGKN